MSKIATELRKLADMLEKNQDQHAAFVAYMLTMLAGEVQVWDVWHTDRKPQFRECERNFQADEVSGDED